MGSTANGYRYPEVSNTPDVPRDIKNLAEDVDAAQVVQDAAIASNTQGVSANASAITALETQVSTNKGDIAANAGDIATNAGDIATNASGISANSNAINSLTASLTGGDAGEVLTKQTGDDGDYEWLPSQGGGGGTPNISTDEGNRIELGTDGGLLVLFPEVNNLVANTDSGDIVLTWED